MTPAAACAGLLWAAQAVQAAPFGCHAPSAGLQAQALQSHWRERGERGQTLLREHGTLRGAQLTLQTQCADLTWQMSLSQSQGERAYDGQSTTGAALRTHSTVRHQHLALQATWPLTSDVGVTAQWSQLKLRRELADVGMVRGYPERYRINPLALGLDWTALRTPTWRLNWTAALGLDRHARMDLALPYADPTTLRLGRVTAATSELHLQSSDPAGDADNRPGWGWQAALRAEVLDMRAGPSQALQRNGAVVGGAAQPATRSSSVGLSAGVNWRF